MKRIKTVLVMLFTILRECGKYDYVLTRRDRKTGKIVKKG